MPSADRLHLFDTLRALTSHDFERLLFALKPPKGLVAGQQAPQATRVAHLLGWAESATGRGTAEIQDLLNRFQSNGSTVDSTFSDYLKFVLGDPRYRDVRVLYTGTDAVLTLEAETVEAQNKKPERRGPETLSKKIESFPLLEGLCKYALGEQREHVLLAGRPGLGKSTTLKRLLLRLAKAALEDETQPIPVLVQLKGDHSIFDLISAGFWRARVRVTSEQVEDWLFENRLVLLLDGVNEISSETRRQELQVFRDDNLSTAMVFTTRDLAVGGDLGIEKKLTMRPLSTRQMEAFVDKHVPEHSEILLAQLKNRLQEIAETPLMLKMLCDVFDPETQEIPQNKGELFRLFDAKYDRLKGIIPVSEDFRRFKSEILRHLAFCMIQGDLAKPTEAWWTLERSRAEKILETLLTGRIDAPGQRAKEWLEDLLEHHLLQVAADPREIEFHHQLFQEYYAAEELLARLQSKHPNCANTQRFQYFHLNYLKWTESLSLMAGLLTEENQAVLLVQLASEVDWMLGSQLAGKVKQDFQKESVATVSQLIEKEKLPEWLKVQLLDLTQSTAAIPGLNQAIKSEGYDIRLSVALALEKIASEDTIPVLQDLLKDDEAQVRQASVKAIGKIESRAVKLEILKTLKDSDYLISLSVIHGLTDLKSEFSVSILQEAFKDRNPHIRRAVARALGSLNLESAIPILMTVLEKDENPDVRASSARALGEFGSNVTVHALKLASEDQDSYVRKTVKEALKKQTLVGEENLKEPDQIGELLFNAFNDKGFAAYESWAGKIEGGIPAMIEFLKDKDFVRRERAVEALDKQGKKAAHKLPEIFALLTTHAGSEAFCALKFIQTNCRFYNYEIAQLNLESVS